MQRMIERQIPSRAGRKPKYPWDEWFDGEVHVVEQDKDFYTLVHSFVNMLHQAARRKNGGVETSTEGAKITFVFIPNDNGSSTL